MRLTPLDIRKQEFKRTMRGYDRDEVNAFLEMVAEEFDALLREKERLQEDTVRLRTQLHDYQDVERTLKRALKNTEDTAQQAADSSKRQAEIVVREAELQAEKILRDTKQKLADLKNELMLVRAQKDSFARRLRHLLESQLELIGVLELDDLGFGEPDNLPAAGETFSERAKAGFDGYSSSATEPMEVEAPRRVSNAPKPEPVLSRGEAGRPTRAETARRSNNRPTGPLLNEFRPVAEATGAAAAKESQHADKKETRISDHLIT